jgi:hypothetical protein
MGGTRMKVTSRRRMAGAGTKVTSRRHGMAEARMKVASRRHRRLVLIHAISILRGDLRTSGPSVVRMIASVVRRINTVAAPGMRSTILA